MITVDQLSNEMQKLINEGKGHLPVFCDFVAGEDLNEIAGLQWLLKDGITQVVEPESAEVVLIEYD